MRLIKEIMWILLFSLVGEVISIFLASIISIPASVIGMFLLFLALHYKLIKLEQVEGAGNWLTDNMAIFFVPVGVGLILNFDLLKSVWWQLIILVIVTVAILLFTVGHTVQKIKNNK